MKFPEILKEGILLFDGAMGTQIQAKGVEYDCPEMLNIDNPDVIADVHRSYVDMGSNVVETNTLGANTIKLKKHSLQDKTIEINKAAVALAKEAVGDKALVALSMGPSGELLVPFGMLTFDELLSAYSDQIKGGIDADILFFETISDMTEGRIGLIAARETSDQPVVLSITFEGMRTLMGNSPESCAILADKMGISALGVNCSGGPDELLPVLVAMRKYCSLPIIIQPNAGIPSLEKGITKFPFDAETMGKKMIPILKNGASSIGGCCGTTPEHIRILRENVDKFTSPEVTKVECDYITSRRAFLKLEDAINNSYTHKVSENSGAYDLMDISFSLGDVVSVTLDISDLSYDKIKELMLEGQDMPGKPLLFKVANRDQAEAALRHYHGIAGIYAKENMDISDIAKKYGAYIL